jgi:hypothetical protein
VKSRGPERRNGDAIQLELSNFQPLAANEAIEEEVPDLGGAEQLSEPMIEDSDQGLASLIRSVGITSITDIDNLVSELQEARDYLQSEGERIRAEVAHYAALAGAASASVKIIFDVLRAWRTTGHPAHNQSQGSAFEITDAVIEDRRWHQGSCTVAGQTKTFKFVRREHSCRAHHALCHCFQPLGPRAKRVIHSHLSVKAVD